MADHADTSVLRTSNVALSRNGKTIARLPDLAVAPGHAVAIVGPSGSGKTIEGSAKRRFFVVLHVPPIIGPREAVRAAIVAEQRAK